MSKGRMTTGTEVAVDNLSTRRNGGAAVGAWASSVPNPEVAARPTRRRFTAEYKLRVLRESESLSQPGAIGALLRREGLYSTHLSAWRRQRDRGALEALKVRRRGPKPDPSQELRQRIAELESDKQRLQERLRQAEAIISAPKKLSEILGLSQAVATPSEAAADDAGAEDLVGATG
jgi:transposase